MPEQPLVQENLPRKSRGHLSAVDPVWQEQMVLQYAPFIRYIVSRMALRLPSHICQEDLISAGIIGLVDAIQKYDRSRNIHFKTYSEFRIKGAIMDELRSLDWVPRSVRDKAHRIENAYAELQTAMGRPAEAEEVAAHLGMELEDFYQLLDKAKPAIVVALDGCDLRVADTPGSERDLPEIRQEGLRDSLQMVQLSELREEVLQAINALPDNEKLLISLYYYEELTMKEIGQVMGYTESRISQLHSQAMCRLRIRLREYCPAA